MQGRSLRRADNDCVADLERVHVPAGGALVGDPEDDGEHGQEDRDLPGLTEVLGDECLAGAADDHGRNRRDEQEPGDPLVRAGNGAARKERNRRDVPREVPPEVRDDGDQGAEVEGDVEGLVELVVLLEVVQSASQGTRIVSGRRDRQELGRPLHQAEDERLPVRERAGDLPTPSAARTSATPIAAPAAVKMPTRPRIGAGLTIAKGTKCAEPL